MAASEKELEILEEIYNSPDKVRQRDLAHIVGLSLGMTNAILKRLAKKGLINVKKVNNRNIQYVVSPDGMEAIAKRSYRYFKRTIKNIVDYKAGIEGIISQAIGDGYSKIILVGESDLDFIVEHICHKKDIEFGRKRVKTERPEWFHLYAETVRRRNRLAGGDGGAQNAGGDGNDGGNSGPSLSSEASRQSAHNLSQKSLESLRRAPNDPGNSLGAMVTSPANEAWLRDVVVGRE